MSGLSRVAAIVVGACVVASAWFGVAAWRRAHPPAPGPLGVVACRVGIPDPSSGLAQVRIEVEDQALANRRALVLVFGDVQVPDQRVRAFHAVADGRPASVTVREISRQSADNPGADGLLVYFIEIPDRARRLTIDYTIDPTYFPPDANRNDPADARSRIAPELAIVRSSSLLPRFDVTEPGVALGVEFDLPTGWIAATPWPLADGRVTVPAHVAAPAEYLAIGPFETRDVAIGAAVVHVATPALAATGPFPVEAIVSREMELLAAPLKRTGPFLATIVPDSFMHGGAAGDRSIVQSSAPHVLAHEVFHWWNDGRLTARDASWFREGLTEYYGIRVARETGAWSTEAETACLADLEGEMRRIEQDVPHGLREASLDPRLVRLVYSKGALFWLMVDRQLRASGRYLEEAVRRVVTSPREGLRSEDLRSVFSGVYGGDVDDAFERFVVGTERLPELGLPAPTGRSGCARE